jgi:anti-anti-sigma regulatory factor
VAVRCPVIQDDGRLLVRLDGRLDRSGTGDVRKTLLKCLAEHPEALIVDVSRLRVADFLELTVFLAVIRQAALWPGTPVLLCAPSPHTAGLLGRAAYRRIPVFADVDAARDEARHHRAVLPSISDVIPPVAGAARQARNVATDACLRWNLPMLVGPAGLVAGELVSNAVAHAETMMTVRLSLSPRLLHVAVRDGSIAEARLPAAESRTSGTGWGLRLVDAVALSWGSLPATGGKVVWAVLPLDPPAADALP